MNYDYLLGLIRRRPDITLLEIQAGLRLRGLTATRTFDGPLTAALFADWLETCLVPTLSPGEIVVWTISPLTRGRGSSNSSRRRARRRDISQPTVLI